jgi:hypothetical protein
VCPNDTSVDAATAALVDVAEPIDQEVVTDVVPVVPGAMASRVPVVDVAHLLCRLCPGVVVGRRGVMDDGEGRVPVTDRSARAGLVGSPLGPRDDVRTAIRCLGGRGGALAEGLLTGVVETLVNGHAKVVRTQGCRLEVIL